MSSVTILGVTVTQMQENWPNILSLLLNTAGEGGAKGEQNFDEKFFPEILQRSFLYIKIVLFQK